MTTRKEDAMSGLLRWGSVLVLGMGMCAAGFGQVTSAPASDAARWGELAGQLSSEDFAKRSAAQKALGRAGFKDRELLAALAAESVDPEVKARLLARVGELDDQGAVEPALLAVHVEKVGLKEAMGELSRVTGLAFYEAPCRGAPFFTAGLGVAGDSGVDFLGGDGPGDAAGAGADRAG
jgi:hypothetical protein